MKEIDSSERKRIREAKEERRAQAEQVERSKQAADRHAEKVKAELNMPAEEARQKLAKLEERKNLVGVTACLAVIGGGVGSYIWPPAGWLAWLALPLMGTWLTIRLEVKPLKAKLIEVDKMESYHKDLLSR
jgi:Flp pilus assembly protein TadB